MTQHKNIYIVANAAWGPLLSGGDNIFIECARRWAAAGRQVSLIVWEEGLEMCRRNDLSGVAYVLWPARTFKKFGFIVHYTARIVLGIWRALRLRCRMPAVIYSASDFWPDVLPAFILKMRHRACVWTAGFYLFAPRPWDKSSPYRKSGFWKGAAFWLSQQPVFWLIRRWADTVFVTSAPDVPRFVTPRRPRERVVAVRGGVDPGPARAHLASENVVPIENRKYDACFIGRFHEQKGVLELVDIWRRVVDARPSARLALIGDGPLAPVVRDRIASYRLDRHIDLLGFKNGAEKFRVFQQSRLVVHPATYDSGGMAAAEAMAWRLPGVAFDLETLKTYYPKGMLKAPLGDNEGFAKEIIHLLQDPSLYEEKAREAQDLIAQEWDWGMRAEYLLEAMEAPLAAAA